MNAQFHISVPLIHSEMHKSLFQVLYLHFLQALFNADEANIAVKEVTIIKTLIHSVNYACTLGFAMIYDIDINIFICVS